jgi:hypothetical protein
MILTSWIVVNHKLQQSNQLFVLNNAVAYTSTQTRLSILFFLLKMQPFKINVVNY